MKTTTLQHFSTAFAKQEITVYNKFVSMFVFCFRFDVLCFIFVWFRFRFEVLVFGFRVSVLDALTPENNDTTSLFNGFRKNKNNVYNKFASMFCFLFSFWCILFSFRLISAFAFKLSVLGFRVSVLDALTPENNDTTTLFNGFCKSTD